MLNYLQSSSNNLLTKWEMNLLLSLYFTVEKEIVRRDVHPSVEEGVGNFWPSKRDNMSCYRVDIWDCSVKNIDVTILYFKIPKKKKKFDTYFSSLRKRCLYHYVNVYPVSRWLSNKI